VAGARRASAADPDLLITLVGPPDVAAAHPDAAAFDVAPASEVIAMGADAARAVRSQRDATIRVACRLVRDGEADGVVSIGSTGAALAAAVFTLGRLPGVTRPGLAVVVPAPGGHLVLLDTGASADAGPEQLAQLALAGSAFAQVALGVERPRVGLLTIGEEPGKGDQLRREAWPLLEALESLDVDFVGSVEGHDVPLGGRADVVVTDGFTGNVLLKGVEGAVRAIGTVLGAEHAAAFAGIARQWGPEGAGGGVLLGVPGVVVVGHGSSNPAGVAACVAQAATAVREGLVPRISTAIGALVARRREQAGLAGSSREP
jgi:glycerol-3-phosphate acyltransferase PlsX